MNEHGRRVAAPDFTEIDGVGRKAAEALERAGITSMAELASMTVDQVVLALRKAGAPFSAGKIISRNWLQQAWRLSRSVEVDQAPGVEIGAGGDSDSELEHNAANWEEYAGYFVYFDRTDGVGGQQWRTRVWDTKAMVEESFAGASPGPWISFVLRRANLPASAYTPAPVSFEVGPAAIEQRESPQGPQTWLRAEIAIDVQEQGAIGAALNSALLSAVVPEIDVEGDES